MSWPARTICACLEDMRKAVKTLNFYIIPGLIEEVQMLANRMEAALDTEMSYSERRDKLRKVNQEIKETEEELTKLKNELNLLNKVKELK